MRKKLSLMIESDGSDKEDTQNDSPSSVKILDVGKDRFVNQPKFGLAIDVDGLSVGDSAQDEFSENGFDSQTKDRGNDRFAAMRLNDSMQSLGEMSAMSVELGSQGLKVNKEGYEIGRAGMKEISTGAMIAGNLSEDDLELGRVLGNGASGYVYAAIHKPTGRHVALKSINAFDKPKRRQLVNDLRSLSNHTCPFLVKFFGALFDEGAVKVALELMDMGSLKDIMKLALRDPEWDEKAAKPLIAEPIMAKIV